VSDILGTILGTALKDLTGQPEQQRQAPAGGVLGDILAQALGRTDLGSLSGLLQRLVQSGLATQVASWLGNGSNLPLTADQLRKALGDDTVRQLANQFNLPVDDLLRHLAEHLPNAIDNMSPDGSVLQHSAPSRQDDGSTDDNGPMDDDDGSSERPGGRSGKSLSDLGPD